MTDPRWLLLMMPVLAGCGEASLFGIGGTTGILGADLGAIAVVGGDFERIEDVLDAVEAPYDLYEGFIQGAETSADPERYTDLPPVEDLLGGDGAIVGYNTVFFNCGVRGVGLLDPGTLTPDDRLVRRADVLRNLRAFVAGGGVVYVADQTYGLVEAAIPEAIDFWGPDEVAGAALVGIGGPAEASPVDARAVSTLAEAPLAVDLAARWAVPHALTEVWLTILASAVEADGAVVSLGATPVLGAVPFGDGAVFYSAFHNDLKVDQTQVDLQLAWLRSLGEAR